jgi:hypothetical protein
MERTQTHTTRDASTALWSVNLAERKTEAQVRAYDYNGQADVTQNELALEGRNWKLCDEISEDFPKTWWKFFN